MCFSVCPPAACSIFCADSAFFRCGAARLTQTGGLPNLPDERVIKQNNRRNLAHLNASEGGGCICGGIDCQHRL